MLTMLAVTALTAVNTFNGGFVTLSRFMDAMAREGKLPCSFTRLNDYAVPVVPVWLLGGICLVVSLAVTVTGSFAMMVPVGAALEALIYAVVYAVAAFVVFRLRRADPGGGPAVPKAVRAREHRRQNPGGVGHSHSRPAGLSSHPGGHHRCECGLPITSIRVNR